MNKVIRFGRRLLIALATRSRSLFFRLLSDTIVVGKPRIGQPVLFIGSGTVFFGDNVSIGCYTSPGFFSTYAYIEARVSSSTIDIGSNTAINNASTIICERTTISIGSNCLIGPNFTAYDSDFHPISRIEREAGGDCPCRPVKIEDWVFIGGNVTVLKGSVIGKGATIAAGSVVSGHVPPDGVFGGVPARSLK